MSRCAPPSPLHLLRGFTLVELSVVLIVIALITGMGLVATLGTLESARRAQTENKLDVIEKALAFFRDQNNRLPCPGDITLTDGSAVYGLEAANSGMCLTGTPTASDISGNAGVPPASTGNPPVVQGGIPARTLGLPDEFMFDGWGRRFLYAVDANATASNAFSVIPMSADRCGITVKDAAGGYRSGSASAGGSLYTLVSHGPNGHGAYVNGSSTRISAGSTNTDELNNCNCTSAAATGTVNATFIQKEPTENPTTPTDIFDDIVRFKERWQMQNDTDRADTRSYRRCQMAVGIKDGTYSTSDPMTCYKRGCDGWVTAQPTYLGTSASYNIANLFFAPDNSYLFVYLNKTSGAPGSCSNPTFGLCAVSLDGPSPIGLTTFYCYSSCTDGSRPIVSLTNNSYLGLANVQGEAMQLFRLSGTSFNKLNTASAIQPPVTSVMSTPTLLTISRNAEHFAVADGTLNFKIYTRYETDVFKDMHSSKYPPGLPAAADISAAVSSPDEKLFAVADATNAQVLIWQIGQGNPFLSTGTNPFGVAPIETIAYDAGTDCYPSALAFSPDGQYLAVGLGANDCVSTDDIADSVKLYRIDGTMFTPVTISSGAPNIFYNSSGYNIPYILTFTADSNMLLITTLDPTAGITTLDRVDATTFKQSIKRITGGGNLNTTVAVLH